MNNLVASIMLVIGIIGMATGIFYSTYHESEKIKVISKVDCYDNFNHKILDTECESTIYKLPPDLILANFITFLSTIVLAAGIANLLINRNNQVIL